MKEIHLVLIFLLIGLLQNTMAENGKSKADSVRFTCPCAKADSMHRIDALKFENEKYE